VARIAGGIFANASANFSGSVSASASEKPWVPSRRVCITATAASPAAGISSSDPDAVPAAPASPPSTPIVLASAAISTPYRSVAAPVTTVARVVAAVACPIPLARASEPRTADPNERSTTTPTVTSWPRRRRSIEANRVSACAASSSASNRTAVWSPSRAAIRSCSRSSAVCTCAVRLIAGVPDSAERI
jgi:hypothetical protein